jgi:hypothetical protein
VLFQEENPKSCFVHQTFGSGVVCLLLLSKWSVTDSESFSGVSRPYLGVASDQLGSAHLMYAGIVDV